MILNIKPLFYTVEEVEALLVRLLTAKRSHIISSEQLFSVCHHANYVIKSVSNNTIQGTYYSRRVDILVKYEEGVAVIVQRNNKI